MRVRVEVTRRPEIADPEGTTIKRALIDLDHKSVTEVRVDRVFRLEVEGEDPEQVRRDVSEMCEQLLANPVLEDYKVIVEGS